MVSVRTVLVYAKRDGRVLIVPQRIRMRCSACPIVRAMEHSIWTRKRVTVNRNGVARIARKVCGNSLLVVLIDVS